MRRKIVRRTYQTLSKAFDKSGTAVPVQPYTIKTPAILNPLTHNFPKISSHMRRPETKFLAFLKVIKRPIIYNLPQYFTNYKRLPG